MCVVSGGLAYWMRCSYCVPGRYLRHERVKDLFRKYFAHLSENFEAAVVEYKSFRNNSYANLYYMFLSAA
jgi:hypothetical protein